MSKKSQGNPQLDMTPMIDVVFELIIFFVVTLTQANAKDETVVLEDGRHGIELTPDQVPENHLVIDIAAPKKWYRADPSKVKDSARKREWAAKKRPCVTICDVPVTITQLKDRIRVRKERIGEFPVMIRADEDVLHKDVAAVMGACTENGLWKISFVSIKTHKEDLGSNKR